MRPALAAVALTLGIGGITVTVLPRPAFPGPVTKGAFREALVLVSSRYHAPGATDEVGVAFGGSIPETFRGAPQVHVQKQGRTLFVVYGRDASARYLLTFRNTGVFRYGFDFENFLRPPNIAPGEREFVSEGVVWAREAGGVLYVENAHSTYARSSYGRNGYVTAIDLKRKRMIWRSPALVANARTFIVAGRYLVTGYGFTEEPDYLYLLDRVTGDVVERLKLPSAPERISRREDRLFVRTYDHDVVVDLRKR